MANAIENVKEGRGIRFTLISLPYTTTPDDLDRAAQQLFRFHHPDAVVLKVRHPIFENKHLGDHAAHYLFEWIELE